MKKNDVSKDLEFKRSQFKLIIESLIATWVKNDKHYCWSICFGSCMFNLRMMPDHSWLGFSDNDLLTFLSSIGFYNFWIDENNNWVITFKLSDLSFLC